MKPWKKLITDQKIFNIYNKTHKMTQEQLRMQMLAGIITEGQYVAKLNENEDDNDPDSFDIDQDWNSLKVLGSETDHQGEWVIFADPEDPYLDEEGYSFAVEKRQIDQVANGEKIGVEDGSSVSHYMTSQDAKNILSQI